jgi:hypothetical protein
MSNDSNQYIFHRKSPPDGTSMQHYHLHRILIFSAFTCKMPWFGLNVAKMQCLTTILLLWCYINKTIASPCMVMVHLLQSILSALATTCTTLAMHLLAIHAHCTDKQLSCTGFHTHITRLQGHRTVPRGRFTGLTNPSYRSYNAFCRQNIDAYTSYNASLTPYIVVWHTMLLCILELQRLVQECLCIVLPLQLKLTPLTK